MDFKCYSCGSIKSKDEFYKNNYNRCKYCKRIESRESKISKNDVYEMLTILFEKNNSNEMYIKEIYNKLNNIEKFLMNNIIDNKMSEIDSTIDNINVKNQKINYSLNDIIKYRNNIVYDEKYEKEMKDILED